MASRGIARKEVGEKAKQRREGGQQFLDKKSGELPLSKLTGKLERVIRKKLK